MKALSKTSSKKTQTQTDIIQDFFPIEKSEYGFIKQSDGKYVKILEVESCEYEFESVDNQWAVVQRFANVIEGSCFNLHIKVTERTEDLSVYLNNIQCDYGTNETPYTNERVEDYVNFTKSFVNNIAKKSVSYFIFSYEGDYLKSEMEIYEELDMVVNEYVSALQAIGCNVTEGSYTNADYPMMILYQHNNPVTCLKESIQSRYSRIMEDYSKYNLRYGKSKTPTIKDIICPKGLDFTKSNEFVIKDGLYTTWLTIRGNSIPDMLSSEFIHNLRSYGTVDIYLNRQLNQKVTSSMKMGEKGRQVTTSARQEESTDTTKIERTYSYYENLNYIRNALQNAEHLYETVIVIEMRNESYKELQKQIRNLKQIFEKSPYYLSFRETYCNTTEMFLMTQPLMLYDENDEIFNLNARGFLTSSMIGLLPFYSKDFEDATGTIWGINSYTKGIISINPFNRDKGFQNANITILGGSGSGKSFFEMCLGSKLYMQGLKTLYICPLKGHEYENLVRSFDGTYIALLPSCDSINIFEIRPEIVVRGLREVPLLTKKITQIITFIKLSMPSMTDKESGLLNIALMGLYQKFDITVDNDSIYNEDRTLKKMPLFEDLYNYIKSDLAQENKQLSRYQGLEEVMTHIERYIWGSWSNLNKPTSVDLTKRCIVVNCDEDIIGKDYVAPIMYLAVVTLFDIVKSSGISNDVIIADEVWKCMVSEAGEQIKEIVKTIRGYQGGLVVASQQIGDFFNNPYGEAIIASSDMKIVKRMRGGINEPKSEVMRTCNALGLDAGTYVPIIKGLDVKEGIIITPQQNLKAFIHSSYSERIIYGTDNVTGRVRQELGQTIGWGNKTFTVKDEDMLNLYKKKIISKEYLD